MSNCGWLVRCSDHPTPLYVSGFLSDFLGVASPASYCRKSAQVLLNSILLIALIRYRCVTFQALLPLRSPCHYLTALTPPPHDSHIPIARLRPGCVRAVSQLPPHPPSCSSSAKLERKSATTICTPGLCTMLKL